MSFKSSVNHFRRRLMGSITHFLGKTRIPKRANPQAVNEIKRIFVCRPNHRLGNLILITPLIQELEATFPNCTIDLLIQGGVGPIIFKNYTVVDKIIQLPRKPFKALSTYLSRLASIKNRKYDLAINAVPDSSSGKLYTRLARSTYRIYGDLALKAPYNTKEALHIAQFPVLSLRNYLELLGMPQNTKPIPTLNLKLAKEEFDKGKEMVLDLVKNKKTTISIFTFATGTKIYTKTWWSTLYVALVEAFPDCNIIEILPVENVSQIDFKAPTLYSKDIREMASLMSNTAMFIGADSGIMHLASASGVSTAGLFSVTIIDKYKPYGNGSFPIDTTKKDVDYWIQQIKLSLGEFQRGKSSSIS